jgi:hypothetical protein
MGTIDRALGKAETQVNGMKDLASISTGAPASASEVTKEAAELKRLRDERIALRAALLNMTTDINSQMKKLRETVARNVSFFQSKLGKRDPRIGKVGGKVLVSHGRTRKPQAAPDTSKPAP